VLGSPISHSLSPALHRAAYSALGLAWTYSAVECSADDLPRFVASLDDSWRGLSLTMPLKEAVLPLLDTWSVDVDRTGAANTLLLETDGGRTGLNTDVSGFVDALAEAGVRQAKSMVILGTGATARSAAAAARSLGVQRLAVVGRRPTSAAAVLEVAAVEDCLSVDWDRAQLDADLVISTVPPGVADGLIERVPASPGWLFDVVYADWPTPLATAWVRTGAAVLGGMDLLLHQAFAQVTAMTGLPAPQAAMRVAAAQATGLT
jgi:shikimate dehydrogenase